METSIAAGMKARGGPRSGKLNLWEVSNIAQTRGPISLTIVCKKMARSFVQKLHSSAHGGSSFSPFLLWPRASRL
jgi:hypothetical protein